jgi:putative tRNA adenosine deaminase-associated protein
LAERALVSAPGDGQAVLVLRVDGVWQVNALPAGLLQDLDALVGVVRQQSQQDQPLILVDADGEFFVALRSDRGHVRVLLSDAFAAADHPLGEQVLDYLDEDPDEAPGDVDVWPVGDLAIFTDLGMDNHELGSLLEDEDLYVDEALSAVTERLGFGPEYAVVGGIPD